MPDAVTRALMLSACHTTNDARKVRETRGWMGGFTHKGRGEEEERRGMVERDSEEGW